MCIFIYFRIQWYICLKVNKNFIKWLVPNVCTRNVDENPEGYQNPSQQGMEYEDLNITTKDKVHLHGWFIKQSNSKVRPTIIYFHENAGSNFIY